MKSSTILAVIFAYIRVVSSKTISCFVYKLYLYWEKCWSNLGRNERITPTLCCLDTSVSISNDLSSSVVTLFFYFCSWLITTTVTSTRSSLITLKAQPHDSSNHCQTVTWPNVLSCTVHIRFYCDCAQNYLAYFPSKLSRLTKTFSISLDFHREFLLDDQNNAMWATKSYNIGVID